MFPDMFSIKTYLASSDNYQFKRIYCQCKARGRATSCPTLVMTTIIASKNVHWFLDPDQEWPLRERERGGGILHPKLNSALSIKIM